MKITFIEHSGFMVEMEHTVLLFDYYHGKIPTFDKNKTLYVFVSHSHADHYNPVIWELKEQCWYTETISLTKYQFPIIHLYAKYRIMK